MKYLQILLMLLVPTVSLGAVSYDKETSTLRITGSTDMAQVVQASHYMDEHEVQYIEMWGPGGYLEMGLHLGNRISKEEGVTVVVPKNKNCISACAFAAMGSDHIRVDGKLLLHRPFVTAVPSMVTLEESLAYVGRGYLITAYYLEDHGYKRNLMLSIMTYTSPCKFMVFENLEVKKPEDLIMWYPDDSRCRMMGFSLQR